MNPYAYLVGFAVLVGGCGGRSELYDDACVWTPDGRIVDLTDPMVTGGAVQLESLAAEGDRVFVAYRQSFGPDLLQPGVYRLGALVVSDDLVTIGASGFVFSQTYPYALATRASVAAGFGHRGVVEYQAGLGCNFVALAEDGAAFSAPVLVTTLDCYELHATETGYTLLAGSHGVQWTLLSLDLSGGVLATKALVRQGILGLAKFDDGSLLLATTADNTSITVQHLTATGDALSTPREVPSGGSGVGTSEYVSPGLPFAMTGLGSSAFLAMATTNAGILVEALDHAGNVAGTSSLPWPEARSLDIALVRDEALIAGVVRAAGQGNYGFTAQSIWPTGDADGSSFTLSLEREVDLNFALHTVGTPAGALVVFNFKGRLFATRLRCDRSTN